MQLHGGWKSYIDIKYKTHASILQILYTTITVKKASYSVLYYAQQWKLMNVVLREQKTYVQQSWPIREKVKRENRCSTELTNQEKVECVYVFENYLTQQKVIPLAEACNLQRDLYCHHASSLSYRAESSLSTYQSRRERSPLARSAAKSRGVRGQFWLSIRTTWHGKR